MLEAVGGGVPVAGALPERSEGRRPAGAMATGTSCVHPTTSTAAAARYEWVAIAVEDDEQFAALAGVIGRARAGHGPPLRHARGAQPARRRARAALSALDGRARTPRRRAGAAAGRRRAGRAGGPHRRPVRLTAAARARVLHRAARIPWSGASVSPVCRGWRRARRWWRPPRRRAWASTPRRSSSAGSASPSPTDARYVRPRLITRVGTAPGQSSRWWPRSTARVTAVDAEPVADVVEGGVERAAGVAVERQRQLHGVVVVEVGDRDARRA